MSLIVTENSSSPSEKPTAGLVDAVCCFVEDVGKQLTKGAFGEKIKHQVVICWEIDQKISEGKYAGKPFMVSRRFTFTLFEKGLLAQTIESWFSKKLTPEQRAAGFDLKSLVGKTATLNLVENGNYINIGSVLPANKNNQMTPVCTAVPEWIIKLSQNRVRDPMDQRTGFDDSKPADINDESTLPF